MRVLAVLLWVAAIAAAGEPDVVPGLIVPVDLEQRAARQARVSAPIVRAIREQAAGRPLGPQPNDRKLDWSEKISVPVIAQGSCGSCWACATAHCLSFQIPIQTGRQIVVSPQDVLNCSGEGSCAGGWVAFGGAKTRGYAEESAVPYVGRKAMCRSNVPRPAKIVAWEYLAASGGRPSDERIKQALCEAGPVWVGIYADGALSRYRPGQVWASPGRSVNHAVVIVGWDDDRHAWRVRNSWGAAWGDKGNFWCEYGSNIGQGASVAYAIPSWFDPVAAERVQALAAEDCDECEVPQIKIEGPETAEAGRLVTLRAPEMAGARYSWTVFPDAAIDQTYTDTGRRVLVIATPVNGGQYWFACSVAMPDVDPLMLRHGLLVAGTDPVPPGPSPEPTPTPAPKPTELTEFGREVRQWAEEVPAASRAAAAVQIASGFAAVAPGLRSGEIETLGEAQARVRGSYAGVLRGQVLLDWVPFFDRLTARYLERKADLGDAELAAAAADQVAAGIRAAIVAADTERAGGADAECKDGVCPVPKAAPASSPWWRRRR